MEGTRVVPQEKLGAALEQVVVAGVAADTAQVKLTLQNVPDQQAWRLDFRVARKAAIGEHHRRDAPSNGVVT